MCGATAFYVIDTQKCKNAFTAAFTLRPVVFQHLATKFTVPCFLVYTTTLSVSQTVKSLMLTVVNFVFSYPFSVILSSIA